MRLRAFSRSQTRVSLLAWFTLVFMMSTLTAAHPAHAIERYARHHRRSDTYTSQESGRHVSFFETGIPQQSEHSQYEGSRQVIRALQQPLRLTLQDSPPKPLQARREDQDDGAQGGQLPRPGGGLWVALDRSEQNGNPPVKQGQELGAVDGVFLTAGVVFGTILAWACTKLL